VEDVSVKFLGKSERDSFLSINQTVTKSLRQVDWQFNNFDDSTWMNPIIIGNASSVKEVSMLPWTLQPRQILQLTEIPKLFKNVFQVRLFPINTTAKTMNRNGTYCSVRARLCVYLHTLWLRLKYRLLNIAQDTLSLGSKILREQYSVTKAQSRTKSNYDHCGNIRIRH
jgi:hypothetical protein